MQRSPFELKTLILNADGRPLSTWPLSLVPAKDGFVAVLKGHAVALENWDDVRLRSPSTDMPVPKTAMLNEYAPVSHDPKFCRRSILLRDRFRCQYCGERFSSEQLTFDHVIPRSAGGRTEWTNILSACVPCNLRKRNTMPNFSGRRGKVKGDSMRPLKEPRRPTTIELLKAGLDCLEQDILDDWGSYLYWSSELQA